MFIRIVKFLGLAFAVVWVVSFVFAWASPISYLQLKSQIRIAPISITWVLDRANEDLISDAYEACKPPILFAWYGSFGGGPVLQNALTVPASAEFEEVVLFRSGIVRESTQIAREKMAIFNEITLSRCFTEPES